MILSKRDEEMNVAHERFLAVLKLALRGKTVDSQWEISSGALGELFDMARIHRVLPLVYEVAYPAVRRVDPALAETVKIQVRRQVMVQTRKTCDFLALYQSFLDAGICPLVMKGILCRELYPKPDLRQSADEDILIRPEQFEESHRLLLAEGLQTGQTEDAMARDYEIPYRKPGSPLYIELHKYPFPPESDAYGDMNRFFADAHQRSVPEEIQGTVIHTMEYTDHLLYLICHAFKHFLHSGFGIRQVCDIILFANRYGSRIRWEEILKKCREIRAERFAAALFRIGEEYLVFDPETAAWPDSWRKIPVNVKPMLADLLSAGIYGDASMSRKHSSNMTLEAVVSRKQGKKRKNAILASALPAPKKLEKRYPYLKKHPYLVPLAWADRLRSYSRETRNAKDNDAAQTVKIGNERIALLREYGVVD